MRRHTSFASFDDTVATILAAGPEPLAGSGTIRGTGDDDVLHGTGGKDRILGLGGDDQLYGMGGRDVLVGGTGADLLDGGDGVDVADYRGSAAIAVVFDHAGSGTVHVAGEADDTLRSIERVNGSDAADTFDITAGAPKSLYGEGGDDYFYADPLTFDPKAVSINGGAGVDTLDLSHDSAPPDYQADGMLQFNLVDIHVENAIGSRFADYIVAGNSSPGVIHGMDGNDLLETSLGEPDSLFGDAGDDHLLMYFNQGEGYGGDGNDVIEFSFEKGSNPVNTPLLIDGGDGSDTVRYVDYFGGMGYFSISFELGRNGADGTYTLPDGTIGTLRSIENVDQGSHPDSNDLPVQADIYGNELANVLSGSAGDDTIAPNGQVVPSSNGDTTVDIVTGGPGADTFLITNVTARHGHIIATDRITDFTQSDHDKIDLSQVDAKPQTEAVDQFRFIGSDAFTGHAGELRFEIDGNETLVMADTNGDKVADFALQLDGQIALVAKDFVM